MDYSLDQLRERLHTLPEDVQDAIFAVETADAIGEIQNKYKLHIDQAGDLAEEVGFVMLGLTRPFDFVGRIASKLRVTQMVASQITKDINETIFNPIKESLKKVHSLGETGRTTVKTGPSDIAGAPTETTSPSLTTEPALPAPVVTSEEKPTTPDQLFDQKLKGLFTSSNNTPPASNDPYRESL